MKTNTSTYKLKVINFCKDHGWKLTKEAFNVPRSTIFKWKKTYDQNHDCIEVLNNKTTKPKVCRQSTIDQRIIEFIKQQRYLHKRLGKDKLKPLVNEYCNSINIKSISISTIGRTIKHLKDKHQLLGERNVRVSLMGKTGKLIIREPKRGKKKLRINDFKPTFAGDQVQVDSIIRYIHNTKRYIITAVDVKTRLSFAYAYTSLSSSSATDFLNKLIAAFPFDIKGIQTDNGHEFLKHFEQALIQRKILQYFNYPRCPKMNAYIERFNRTLQDEYINDNIYLLADDIKVFNDRLLDHLYWYNAIRPHFGLKQIPPLKYLINSEYSIQSNMLWTHTTFCNISFFMILSIYRKINTKYDKFTTTIWYERYLTKWA